jgi:hypothetical protein
MPEPEDKAADSLEPTAEETEEIEVVAHSDDEDEELNAGCQFNSSHSLG